MAGDLFAVVVTYNGADYIDKCLQSLRDSAPVAQAIVIDNASTDETVERVRSGFPEASLMEMTANLGFGKANNIGIKQAYDKGAQHVLLLNQDAYMEEGCLQALVEMQQRYEDYFVLSPLQWRGDRQELDSRFALHIGRHQVTGELLSDLLSGRKAAAVYPVGFVNAAVWLMSRRCVELIGLFNPSFEHYGEDADYAQRVNFHGGKLGIVPMADAVHDRGQDTTNLSSSAAAFMQRAMLVLELSRVDRPLWRNFLKAVSILLNPSSLNRADYVDALRDRTGLIVYFFRNVSAWIHNRSNARSTGQCFFPDAEATEIRWSKEQRSDPAPVGRHE